MPELHHEPYYQGIVWNNPFLMTPVYTIPRITAATIIIVASAEALREDPFIFREVRYVGTLRPIRSQMNTYVWWILNVARAVAQQVVPWRISAPAQ